MLNRRISQLLQRVTARKASLQLTAPFRFGVRQLAARYTDGEREENVEAFGNAFGRSRFPRSWLPEGGALGGSGREKMKIEMSKEVAVVRVPTVSGAKTFLVEMVELRRIGTRWCSGQLQKARYKKLAMEVAQRGYSTLRYSIELRYSIRPTR